MPTADSWRRDWLGCSQPWDRWDRHRNARPCAAPLLRRLGVSAWAGEAEDQVLQHARGPCRSMGAGPALLCDSGWITDLRAQLELFSFGSFVERLAERLTVIRYDKPGCGLSDRDGIDLPFDEQVAAALAVADAVAPGRFRLFGASQGGQVAAAIAARCPERVEALVVYRMCAGADLAPAEVRKSLVALVRAHLGLGLKALAGPSSPIPRPRTWQGSPGSSGRAPRPRWPPGCWRSTTTTTSGPCSH